LKKINFCKIFLLKGGVNNLHGMPGLISGIGGAIFAAFATKSSFETTDDKNRLIKKSRF
jgi:hypothetical protein